MQQIRDTLKKTNKRITRAILALFVLHFLSLHVVASALVLCFENNGEVNIESVVGSFMTVPSEDLLHADSSHNTNDLSFNASPSDHRDLAFSAACSKEQRTTRFDQERTLAYLDGIVNTTVEELPRSRVFQLVSYAPPLIEDTITASLKTVVRILYH